MNFLYGIPNGLDYEHINQFTVRHFCSYKPQLRIPVEFGHLFRFISDTRSDLIRTVIPIQFGHLFRFYSDSDSGMNSDRF